MSFIRFVIQNPGYITFQKEYFESMKYRFVNKNNNIHWMECLLRPGYTHIHVLQNNMKCNVT